MQHIQATGVLPARLGMESLPARVGKLASGMIYGVACDGQGVRVPLLAGALACSLESGKQCVLLTQSHPGIVLRKARLAGSGLERPMRDGRLALFHVAADAGKQLFRIGPEAFVAELEQNLASPGVFLVVDLADPLFMLSDPRASMEAVQCYVEWVRAHHHTMLALFAPAADAPREYLTLRLVAENFGGFAIARPAEGGTLLEIRHWFGADGATPRETFALGPQRSPLVANRRAAGDSEEELPPVDSVIYVRGVIGEETAEAWRSKEEAATVAEAVDAARRSQAATLLLPYERAADYRMLREAVSAVRATGRSSLRIVVRERGLRVRAAEVLALMRLGVSSIVPGDVSDAAVKRMVDALQGTRFARPYDADAQQVDGETCGRLSRGQCPAEGFCEAIEELLAASDGFDIPSSLARIDVPFLEAASALSRAHRRGRDLLTTACGPCAWIFLFGCPRAKAPRVIDRVFMSQAREFCGACTTEYHPDRILLALDDLRTSLRHLPASESEVP